MGIWSLLFPSDADRLKKARARMSDGRYDDARKILAHCQAPEAEALYDECCKHLEKGDRANYKAQLAAQGFHGFKVEVEVQNPRRKAELEALIEKELEKAGVDLGMPDLDEDAAKAAFNAALRKVQQKGMREVAKVKIVPVKPGK
ncbi:MAG: hypothetical protein U0359_05790 [Byssovorax sp.]